MQVENLNWDYLRLLLVIADKGGLSAASRIMRLDPGTVGRRLNLLETQVGCKLFFRTRRGLEPTSAGQKLCARARRMDDEVNAIWLELSAEDRGLRGHVSITATEATITGLIAPSLKSFRDRHPEIWVELISDLRVLDLGRREADIAVRFVRPHKGELRVRRFGSVGNDLYASPDYIKRYGIPQENDSATAFHGHLTIGWPVSQTALPLARWIARIAGNAVTVLRSDSVAIRLAAAQAGVGIALLPCIAADNAPGLVRLQWRADPAPIQDLWLVSHNDVARIPRVRAVLEFIALVGKRGRPALLGLPEASA